MNSRSPKQIPFLKSLLAACAVSAALWAPARADYNYDITGTVVDSAGTPIVGAKVALQSDTTQFTTTAAGGTFHLASVVSIYHTLGTPKGNGLSLQSAGGRFLLQSPKAAIVDMEVSALDGRVVRSDKQARLSAGPNTLETLFQKPLPQGMYVLRVKGDGLSLTANLRRMEDAPARVTTSPSQNSPSLAKSAVVPATPDFAPGLAVSKSGYAPMLYVPTLTVETGVSVALKKPLTHVGHIIVIYLENWSFDALYGSFPGANGLSNTTIQQTDSNGVAYSTLPRPWNVSLGVADSSFPANLSNAPFNIMNYKTFSAKIPDLVHRFYHEQLQIDSGRMDQFANVSDARGLSMGYYPTDSLPMKAYASQYTLCDNLFHSAFGGSFLNHQWLISARTPLWASIPTKYRATLDGNGKIHKTGPWTYSGGDQATPEGYLVNTLYTHNAPHPSTAALDQLVPDITNPTIGDRLTAAGINWAWYSGGWNKALMTPAVNDSQFQYHHQPFAYYANYADGTPGKAAHLKDYSDLVTAIKTNMLPPVVFYKPVGLINAHPGYASLDSSERATKALIDSIKASPIWNDAVIIVTYDEHGGQHDHVAPPVIDKWGPGTRVPGLVISPFPMANVNHVDHTQYETVSILSFIERRYGLLPLSSRDAKANDFSKAFVPGNL